MCPRKEMMNLNFVENLVGLRAYPSAVDSLLPHNLIFKSPLNFFCLDLQITISVFLSLSEILFAFNKFARYFKSALTSFCSVF